MVDGVQKRRQSRLPKDDPRTLSQVGGDIQQGLGNMLRGAMSAGEFVAENPRLVGETLGRGASYALPGSSTAEFVGMAPELTSNELAPGVMELLRQGKYSEAASLAAFLGLDFAQLSGVGTIPATLIKGGRGLTKGIGELADIAEQQRLLSIESGGPLIGGGGSDVPTKAELNELGERIQQASRDGDDDLKASLIAERRRKQALFDEAKAQREQAQASKPKREVEQSRIITGTTDTLRRPVDMVTNPLEVMQNTGTVISPVARGIASLDESLKGESLTGNEFIAQLSRQPGVTDTKLQQSGILTLAEEAGDNMFFTSTGSVLNQQGANLDDLIGVIRDKAPVRGSIINEKAGYGRLQMTKFENPADLSYGATHFFEDANFEPIETAHTMKFPDMPVGTKVSGMTRHGSVGGEGNEIGIGHSRGKIVVIRGIDNPSVDQDDIGKHGFSNEEDQADLAKDIDNFRALSKGMTPAQLDAARNKSQRDLKDGTVLFNRRMSDAFSSMNMDLTRNVNRVVDDIHREMSVMLTSPQSLPDEDIIRDHVLLVGHKLVTTVRKSFADPTNADVNNLGFYEALKVAYNTLPDGAKIGKTIEEELSNPAFWKHYKETKPDNLLARTADVEFSNDVLTEEFFEDSLPDLPFEQKAPGSRVPARGRQQSPRLHVMTPFNNDPELIASFFAQEAYDANNLLPTDVSPFSALDEALTDFGLVKKRDTELRRTKANQPYEENVITRRSLDQYQNNKDAVDQYFTLKADAAQTNESLTEVSERIRRTFESFSEPAIKSKVVQALNDLSKIPSSPKSELEEFAERFEREDSGLLAASVNSFALGLPRIFNLVPLFTNDYGAFPDFEQVAKDFGYGLRRNLNEYSPEEATEYGKRIVELQELLRDHLYQQGLGEDLVVPGMTDLASPQDFLDSVKLNQTLKQKDSELQEAANDLSDRLFSPEEQKELKLVDPNKSKSIQSTRTQKAIENRFGAFADKEARSKPIDLPFEKASEMTSEFVQTDLSNFISDISFRHVFDPDTGEIPKLDDLLGKDPQRSIHHYFLQQHPAKLAKAREGQVRGVEGFRVYQSGFNKGSRAFMENNPNVFTSRKISSNADVEDSLIKRDRDGNMAEDIDGLDTMLEFTPEFRRNLALLLTDVDSKIPVGTMSGKKRIDLVKKEVRRRLPEIIGDPSSPTGVIQSFAKGGMVYKGIGSMGREVL